MDLPTSINLPGLPPPTLPNWLRVQLRVSAPGARCFVMTAEEVAGLFPADGDGALPEWALEALAEGGTHILFLGEPGHTQITRAS